MNWGRPNWGGGELTMDRIRAAMAAVQAIPPAPIFASSKEYPRESFWSFDLFGRTYVIGHPDLWASIPRESALVESYNHRVISGLAHDLAAIEIVDVDNHRSATLRHEIATFLRLAPRLPGDPAQWPDDCLVDTPRKLPRRTA